MDRYEKNGEQHTLYVWAPFLYIRFIFIPWFKKRSSMRRYYSVRFFSILWLCISLCAVCVCCIRINVRNCLCRNSICVFMLCVCAVIFAQFRVFHTMIFFLPRLNQMFKEYEQFASEQIWFHSRIADCWINSIYAN